MPDAFIPPVQPPSAPVAPTAPVLPKPPSTRAVFLQGGPLHGRVVRVQDDKHEIEMDAGNKEVAKYKRSALDSPGGVPFDYIAPPKVVPPTPTV